jgi:3-hydroxyisobutyrate dehydrogenase-like beta-hydroxyacid dehydrogenase
MLRLVGIGALGNMLSPAAYHLNKESEARFIRIYDRNPLNPDREERRKAWRMHGANLVSTYEQLISPVDFEGIVVCVGKNGDDVKILTQIISLVRQYFSESKRPFILHCSTVSLEFVTAAYSACEKNHITYLNYPLTGGEKGAQNATMLILASGDEGRFKQLKPFLQCLGRPKYFSQQIDAAAKVKLISHLMVFNGLIGISSAVAMQTKSLNLTDMTQEAFFDFLNQGGGGTRQWDVTMKQAVGDDNWLAGFLLPHATIDAIYTADFLIKYNMPSIIIYPILQLATAFSFLMNNGYRQAATQSILKALLETPVELEQFALRYEDVNTKKFLQNIGDSLPSDMKNKVKLDISTHDFLGK